ncbi:hypothetical protein BVIR_1489 [Blastochloris viridis]|uniref:DUF2786 domain-containing protein n=2 Tax=Blastochloris viridis TaxID=1079 RepID=A0A0H5BF58_BLAVI|nr:hypothetical protein BVIR_1489 [Blastochloris viridis]BAS00856.1 hypothetical protein BV133_3262 [Blastochloris viridis]CUU41935.1 hypothetical protein BVIRIDIS_09340 [Blastochloris viridis]
MKKPSARELPLVKRRIEALLEKTEANGCPAGEAAAALEKAEELVAKYGLDPGAFRWPPRPSTQFGSAASGPEAPRPPRASGPSRGKGIGRLAERLIIEHSDCTYAAIAAEVNRLIEGARASEKSVRWSASRMRRRGEDIANRRKNSD